MVDVEDEESDFAYDWHVSFSTVSPIRLAAGTTFDLSVAMASDDEVAQTYGEDWKAATSALSLSPLSHVLPSSYTLPPLIAAPTFRCALSPPSTESILSQPSSSTQLPTHPLFRTLLSTLSLPLTLAVDFLTLYYWYTRRASTGIAMPSQLIDASLDVLWRVLAGLVYDSWDPIEVVKVGVLWWMQIGLLGGWGWEQLGWPKGWAMPGLLGRRKEREGSEERKSWRCDVGGLGWGMRAGVSICSRDPSFETQAGDVLTSHSPLVPLSPKALPPHLPSLQPRYPPSSHFRPNLHPLAALHPHSLSILPQSRRRHQLPPPPPVDLPLRPPAPPQPSLGNLCWRLPTRGLSLPRAGGDQPGTEGRGGVGLVG